MSRTRRKFCARCGPSRASFRPLKGRSVLTVGDFDGFSHRGGMIRFITVGNEIRLRINLAAAQEAKLTISSKLLRPAQIVEPGQD